MTTIRQATIKKLDDLRHSVTSCMDYKDEIADFSDRIPEKQELPGLTDREYSTLLQGYSCPRMVSELLSDLFEEIPEKSEVKEEIKKVEAILTALREIKKSEDEQVDALFTSKAYSILDDHKIPFDWHEYEWDASYLGDCSIMKKGRILKISLEIELRQ